MISAGLAVVWGFGLTSILVRAIGLHELAKYVLIAAFGIYLSAGDLGVSDLMYARLRAAFFSGNVSSIANPVRATLTTYTLIALIAMLAYIAIIARYVPRGTTGSVAPALFFFNSVCYFPWIMIRAILNATNRHIEIELVDIVRRVLQLFTLFSIAVGINITTAYAIIDLVWLGSLGIGYAKAAEALGYKPNTIFHADGHAFHDLLKMFGVGMRQSFVFAGAESAIYLFPYVYIPLTFGAGTTLVIYDLFYKFFRTAITINQIASSGLLPNITEAYHRNSFAQVRLLLLTVGGLGLAAMAVYSGILLLAGRFVFGLLLHSTYVVPGTVTLAIAIVGIGNAVQNAGGSFIIGVGLVRLAQWIALGTAAVMVISAAALAALRIPFCGFMLTYATVYAVGAAAWGCFAWRLASGNPLRGIRLWRAKREATNN